MYFQEIRILYALTTPCWLALPVSADFFPCPAQSPRIQLCPAKLPVYGHASSKNRGLSASHIPEAIDGSHNILCLSVSQHCFFWELPGEVAHRIVNNCSSPFGCVRLLSTPDPLGFADKETKSTKHLPFVPSVYWVQCVSQWITYFLHGENPVPFHLKLNVVWLKVHRLDRDTKVAQYHTVLAAAQFISSICLLVVTAKVCTLSGSHLQCCLLKEKNVQSPALSKEEPRLRLCSSHFSLCPAMHSCCLQWLLNSTQERMTRNDKLEHEE